MLLLALVPHGPYSSSEELSCAELSVDVLVQCSVKG